MQFHLNVHYIGSFKRMQAAKPTKITLHIIGSTSGPITNNKSLKDVDV